MNDRVDPTWSENTSDYCHSPIVPRNPPTIEAIVIPLFSIQRYANSKD